MTEAFFKLIMTFKHFPGGEGAWVGGGEGAAPSKEGIYFFVEQYFKAIYKRKQNSAVWRSQGQPYPK